MKTKITFSQLLNNRGKGKFKQPLNCVICHKAGSSSGETLNNLLLDKNGYCLFDSLNNKLLIRAS